MSDTIVTQHKEWVERNPLRVYRKEQKIGLLDAASMLGVSMKTIQMWESGAGTPTDANLGRVAELLGMPNLPERWHRWLDRNPTTSATA